MVNVIVCLIIQIICNVVILICVFNMKRDFDEVLQSRNYYRDYSKKLLKEDIANHNKYCVARKILERNNLLEDYNEELNKTFNGYYEGEKSDC